MAGINCREWPFLSNEDFDLACTHLEQKYTEAKLNHSRFTFKLCTRRIASTGLSYIEIVRLLQPPGDVSELSTAFERLSAVDYKYEECDTNSDLMNEFDEVSKFIIHCPILLLN